MYDASHPGAHVGRELNCTVRWDGRTASGKALLETNEVTFRGDFRLKIPLASLESVVVRNGDLHLGWPGDAAVFEIGPQAEKWAHKILHPKSTAEKLGIKPGLVISAIAMDDESVLRDLCGSSKLFSGSRGLRNSDLIFFGAKKSEELARIARLVPLLKIAGALWIVYPKGKREITEMQVLGSGRASGLVDVKVVSFSPTHTAHKFVRPKASRST